MKLFTGIASIDDPFYSETNQDYILKSINELREGKGTAHELLEIDIEE